MSEYWFDDVPVIGRMPRDAAARRLREIGEDDAAEALEAVGVEAPGEIFGLPDWVPFAEKPWQYTAHAFGYLAPALPGDRPLPISHAGNIEPDPSLKNARIKVTLDRLRVANYPGGGTHLVLFDFYAQNQADGQLENVHYNATVRAHEGQEAGLIGFPIFVGLSVGAEGVAFKCRTVNVKNEQDEAFLEFLQGEAFQTGLKLAQVAQPALVPLSHMAFSLVKAIQARSRNVPVQDFQMGLDFSANVAGTRLAEGNYVAVQIPSKISVVWDWSDWVYQPTSGRLVSASDPQQTIPYNYLVFGINRYQGDQ